MHRHGLLLIAMILGLAGTVAATDAPDVASRIDPIFAWCSKPGLPGAAVSVIRDGEVVFSKGYGLANLELDVPITPKSVFYLGSVSKQFVAASITLLEQEGKLSLDDDIRKYIPELPDHGTPITIRHLVHHTSGIRDYLELMNLAGLPLGTFHDNEGIVELLARQKATNFTPGDERGKLNSGEELEYAFGLVIGERKGLRFVLHGGALGGYRANLVRFPDERFSVIVLSNVSVAQPGALAMQIADLYLADRYTETDEGEEVDPPKTVQVSAEELERVTGLYWNAEQNYSRKLYVNEGGVLIYSRGPQSESPLAPLGNDRFRMPGAPVKVEVEFRGVREGKATEMVVTVADDEPVISAAYDPVDVTPAYLAAYAGAYHSEELLVDYELFVSDGTLMARGPDGDEIPLTPGIEDVFTVNGTAARFTRDEEGIDGLVLDAGRVKGLRFERR